MRKTPIVRDRLMFRWFSFAIVFGAFSISAGFGPDVLTSPTMKLDAADRDLGGIVPALPTVDDFPKGSTGTSFFAVHLRGYQGAIERKVILGLAEERGGPCVRFDDSGGFSFATTLPGGIAWDPIRGTINSAVAVYRALVHNWYSHFPIGCESQEWDDTGAAMGTVGIHFEPTSIQISRFGVGAGAECKGGCAAGWNELFGHTVTLSAAQRADLANPKVPEVIIPFRYRASFTENSAKEGDPCFENEAQRKDVNCTWTGASLAYLHLIRLPSQEEFNRIVEAGAAAALELMQNQASGAGTAASGTMGAYPLFGIGAPMVGSIPCLKDPDRRRCMPVE